jgi:glycosyltransferase involved in cell wall biosynthesis
MRVLFIVAGLWKNHGGPSEVIPNLSIALTEQGCSVTILTVSGDDSDAAYRAIEKGVKVISFDEKMRLPIRYTPGMKEYLKQNVGQFDLVHNHGHWLYPNWLTYFFAKKARIPLVTTPHGTLVPGMLEKSKLKKFISWYLFDRAIIKQASFIQALSNAESDEMTKKIQNWKSKIGVIPNGTFIDYDSEIERDSVLSKYNVKNGKKVLLFLSRVNEIKGVFDLLTTWPKIQKEFPDWHLLVVGPIDDKIKDKLNAVCENLQNMTLTGPVYGADKKQIFKASDLFVLPSYAEGLPTAILEASSYKLPVVFTTECNFPELAIAKGGVECDAGKSNIEKSLIKAMSMSNEELTEIATNGFNLIQENYSWESVSLTWLSLYKNLVEAKCP